MKRLIVFIGVWMFFLVGNVVHAGQFGPPEPATKEGQSAGLGYFYYSAKWEPRDTEFGEIKINQNQAYLEAGYSGFIKNKNCEFYLRLGGADAEIKKAFLFDSVTRDFTDSLKFSFTTGFKGLLYSSRYFGVGPFVQASIYLMDYKDKKTGTILGIPVSETITIKNPWDVNLGVGLQGKILGVVLYGGPVVYWARSQVKVEAGALGVTSGRSTTYKEKSNAGGFAGFRLPLGKGFSIEIEGQLKSRFSFGGALTYFSK